MKLLDNVYYWHAENGCWKPSFLISTNEDTHRYLVAGYGPHLHLLKVLSEDDYIKLVDDKKIEKYTNQIKELK